jgi:hypothetical protein
MTNVSVTATSQKINSGSHINPTAKMLKFQDAHGPLKILYHQILSSKVQTFTAGRKSLGLKGFALKTLWNRHA